VTNLEIVEKLLIPFTALIYGLEDLIVNLEPPPLRLITLKAK
jgi:hypothetical protein